ncbi:MAG: serine/threonine-protein kinase [Planctomycetota bacterium]|nr:MAG: serine/threonine-protein kinase [Planctomycetota bacterium]
MTPTAEAICRAGAELCGLPFERLRQAVAGRRDPARALLEAGLLDEEELDLVLESAYGEVQAAGGALAALGSAQSTTPRGSAREDADDVRPAAEEAIPGLRPLLERLRRLNSEAAALPPLASRAAPRTLRPSDRGPEAEAGRTVAPADPRRSSDVAAEVTPELPPRTLAPIGAPSALGTARPATPPTSTLGPQRGAPEPEEAPSEASSTPPQARGAAGVDLLAGAAAPAAPPPENEESPTVRAEPGPPLCDQEAQERLAEAVFAAWARRQGASEADLAAARASGDALPQALVDAGALDAEAVALALEGEEDLSCARCASPYSLSASLLELGLVRPCPRCGGPLRRGTPPAAPPDSGEPTTPPAYRPRPADDDARTQAKASDRLPQAPDSDRLAGLHDYEILGELARGGMGIVYKARQKSLGRLVCLKVMRSAATASPDDKRRFLREAEAAARLSHPNIVPVYEVGEHQGQCFFSMEYVDGEELGRWVKKTRPPLHQLVSVLAEVCRAVHFAHQHGIIHRDLKPANVMVDRQGRPHVMDFGIAKRLDAADDSRRGPLTQEGEIMGTPHYMAPEQAEGKVREVDVRSDVWALGVIGYELFTGQRPFRDENILRLLKLVAHAEPKPPSVLRPELDPDLETIVLKALEKEKERRYPTALSLAEELERWQKGEAILARRASRLYRLRKWAQRNRALATTLAASAAALLLLTGLFTAKLVGDRARRRQALDALLARARLDLEGGRARAAFAKYAEAVYRDRERLEAREGYVTAGLSIARTLLAEGAPGRAEEVLRQLRYVDARRAEVEKELARAADQRRRAVEIGVARQRRAIAEVRRLLRELDALPKERALSATEERDYVVSLVRNQDPETVALLRRRLRSEGDRTRRLVARALGWIGDASALPELTRLLDGPLDLAAEAAGALGQIGGERAWEALCAARARRGPRFAQRTQPALRRLARSLDDAAEERVLAESPDLAGLDPDDPRRIREIRLRTLCLRADRLRLAGEAEAAARAYGEALLLAPDAVEARLGRGLALLALGKIAPAEADFGAVARAGGRTLGAALLGRAECRRRRGDVAGALSDLDELLRADPGRADAHLARARILLAANRRGEAEEAIDAALRLRADYPDALATRAELSLLAGDAERALAEVEAALKLAPATPGFLLVRARALRARGDFSTAARAAGEAARQLPRNSAAHQLLAECLWEGGHPEEACEALARGAAATKDPALLLARARLLSRANRFAEAAAALDALLSRHDLRDEIRASALELRGVARVRQGQPGPALADLRLAVAAAPERPSTHYNLACALARLGALDEAERALSRAASLGSDPAGWGADPDLAALRGRPAFERLLAKGGAPNER